MLKRLKSHLDTAVDKVLSTEVRDDSTKPQKYEYGRPEFLNLNAEKLKVSQDFANRPIVTTNEPVTLPFNAGYAEYVDLFWKIFLKFNFSFKLKFVLFISYIKLKVSGGNLKNNNYQPNSGFNVLKFVKLYF